MSRPLRIEYPGAVYHITSRGNARQRIYRDDDVDRADFLNILCAVVKKYNWLCHCYCLMDNHYHLLIETPDGNLSPGMRQLNGVYTQSYNRRHGRVGHIFQGRFKAILVEKETHLLELCRYVVLNPVRAKAVENPDASKWSSYRATVGQDSAIPCLTVDWILGQFGMTRKWAVRSYKEFVAAGLKVKSPWNDLRGQILLGGQEFVDKFKGMLKDKELIAEIPRPQRYLGRPELKEIFRGKDQRKRREMMYRAHVRFGYTLKEIADYLGLHYTTVSRGVSGHKNNN
jgi:putative transposase